MNAKLLLTGLGILLLSPFLLAADTQRNTTTKGFWLDHKFNVMGTQARVRLWTKNKTIADIALEKVEQLMVHVDVTMSPFKESSLLSKVNREAADHPVKISAELFSVIDQAQQIAKLTHGAFDISFSSVGYLYDYREHLKPDEEQIKKRLKLINYHSIILDKKHSTVFFRKKGMRIDLGGIAKGYAIDLSIQALKDMGIKEALVTAGGDTFALGDNGGHYWKVGIKHPRTESKVVTVIPVANEAISTSGDYERFFMQDGKRIHHIINPETGKSASEVQSVTIIADRSILADALSTSVFILGVKKGLALIENMKDVSVIIVDNTGKLFYSSDLLNPENSP